jgi:uridine phosphorylase
MLSELSREQWQEALNIPTERLPQALILRGTRNLHGNTQKYRALLDDALDIWSPNALFEDLLLGYLRGTPVAYASVYGAAMASEITHLAAVLGAQRVILTGCCGALVPDIQAGDLVCASAAHTGEGAAQYYLPRRRRVSASPELMEALPDTVRRGPVWTTAALLAESIAELRAWREEEYIAVDMETASVYAVAEYFGIQRVALLFVFDNPLEGEHLLLSDSEKQARRAAGEQAMIAAALDLAAPVAVA